MLAMSDSIVLNTALIQQWITAKSTPVFIEEDLRAKGFDPLTISEYLKEFRKICNGKKQFPGFCCLAGGALLGFISLMLSLTNPVPEMYNFLLFGLTSIAILVVFAGLYLLFE